MDGKGRRACLATVVYKRVEDGCRILCKAIKDSTDGAGEGTLGDHYTTLHQKLQEVETYAIGDTADRCETVGERVMASTHIIQSSTQDDANRWTKQLGLYTKTNETGADDAAELAATDLAFLGLVPDVTHEWVEMRAQQATGAAKKKSRDTWKRILGLVLVGAEAMQLCIITALDAHRKKLRDKYADSIVKNIDGPIVEEAPATETNEATTAANSITANTQPCLDLSCSHAPSNA
jgi:hypothetical protein